MLHPAHKGALVNMFVSYHNESKWKAAEEVATKGKALSVFNEIDQLPVDCHLHVDCSSITQQGWHATEGLHAAQMLEAHSVEIVAEIKQMLSKVRERAHHETENLTTKGSWKQLELWRHGVRNNETCLLLPVTAQVVDSLPEATSMVLGQIKLSVMSPGTIVRRHHGTTNSRVRIHLGISGLDGSRIAVRREWREWKQSRTIAFDDSYEHEVRHSGTQNRVVLIVDIWNRDLSEQQRLEIINATTGSRDLMQRYFTAKAWAERYQTQTLLEKIDVKLKRARVALKAAVRRVRLLEKRKERVEKQESAGIRN